MGAHPPVTDLPRMIAQFAFAARTAEVIDRFFAGPPRAHEKERPGGRHEDCYPQNNPNGDVPHTRHRLPLRSSGSKGRCPQNLAARGCSALLLPITPVVGAAEWRLARAQRLHG